MEPGVGLRDPSGSLPTQANPFCDSVILRDTVHDFPLLHQHLSYFQIYASSAFLNCAALLMCVRAVWEVSELTALFHTADFLEVLFC